MLDPVAHDRQTALTQREKCAARARVHRSGYALASSG